MSRRCFRSASGSQHRHRSRRRLERTQRSPPIRSLGRPTWTPSFHCSSQLEVGRTSASSRRAACWPAAHRRPSERLTVWTETAAHLAMQASRRCGSAGFSDSSAKALWNRTAAPLGERSRLRNQVGAAAARPDREPTLYPGGRRSTIAKAQSAARECQRVAPAAGRVVGRDDGSLVAVGPRPPRAVAGMDRRFEGSPHNY